MNSIGARRTVATLKQPRGLVMNGPGQKPSPPRLMRASGSIAVGQPRCRSALTRIYGALSPAVAIKTPLMVRRARPAPLSGVILCNPGALGERNVAAQHLSDRFDHGLWPGRGLRRA